MFDKDKRSKKVILVSHCILNQNVKFDTLASYPGAITEVVNEIIKAGVGIVQMPCPEMLGIDLDRRYEMDSTVEKMISGKTHVSTLMNMAEEQKLCEDLADGVIFQVKQYIKYGFEVSGVLGVNSSPTCGIETTWAANKEIGGKGMFMKKLTEKLANEGISLEMRGIKPQEIGEAVVAVQDLICLKSNKICSGCNTIG